MSVSEFFPLIGNIALRCGLEIGRCWQLQSVGKLLNAVCVWSGRRGEVENEGPRQILALLFIGCVTLDKGFELNISVFPSGKWGSSCMSTWLSVVRMKRDEVCVFPGKG